MTIGPFRIIFTTEDVVQMLHSALSSAVAAGRLPEWIVIRDESLSLELKKDLVRVGLTAVIHGIDCPVGMMLSTCGHYSESIDLKVERLSIGGSGNELMARIALSFFQSSPRRIPWLEIYGERVSVSPVRICEAFGKRMPVALAVESRMVQLAVDDGRLFVEVQ